MIIINKIFSCVLMFFVMSLSLLHAQTPQFFNQNTSTASNAIPLGPTFSSNKAHNLYAPGVFNSNGSVGTPAYFGNITTVYFRIGTANPAVTYSDFTISLNQGVGAATAFSNLTFNTFTPNFYQASFPFTGAVSNSWFAVTLQTPFYYDPTKSLIFELKTSGTSGGGTSSQNGMLQSSLGQRLYAAYTAATGSTQDLVVDFGFDMTPIGACTAPPTVGTAAISNPTPCFGQSIELSLTGNSIGSGQTYQWQRSSSASGPWINIGTAQQSTLVTTIPDVSGMTYYRCEATCGTSTVASNVVSATVSTPFASGTFTINSTLPTGSGNFQSFADAVNAISCGISGPVTFNVAAGGTYTEKIVLPQINFSTTYPVKFNGNGVTVQYTSTTTYDAILEMDGTKYVTFDSFNFKSLGATHGFGAILHNNCNFDSIINCNFNLESVTATSAANTSGIKISNTRDGISVSNSGASNSYIGNCTILGNPLAANGIYYGILAYGPNSNNVYYNNSFINAHLYSVNIAYANNNLIYGNKISRETKQNPGYGYGLVVSNATGNTKVLNNKVEYLGGTSTNTYCYPFQITGSAGTASNPILIANNVVTNMNSVPLNGGIYINGGTYNNVYHNTVNIDMLSNYTTTTIQAGIQCNSATTSLKNNIVNYRGGANNTKYGIYLNTAPASMDHNNIYMNSSASGTQNYGYLGTAYNSISAFQVATTLELNGTSVDPQFVNAPLGNLLPGEILLTSSGTNLFASVPTDVLGIARKLQPTPGAFEIVVPPAGVDGAVASLISPTGSFCANQQQVKVTVMNTGSAQLSGFQVQWQINGISQTPYTYSGTLDTLGGTGQSIDTITLGTITIPVGNNTLKAWTIIAGDVNSNNDTLMATNISPATFTISAASDTICSGSNANLTLNPSSGYAPGMLQWQVSTDGITFNNIAGATSVSYTSNVLTTNMCFRVFINSGTGGCYSNVKCITVVNPQITTTTPSSRCGTGTVQLTATANAGSTIKWYTTATGGTAIGTGASFTTPTITTTTTYYVAAAISTCESARTPVIATVTPGPLVSLGNDTTFCSGNSLLLNAGNTGATYLWDNAATSQTRMVNTSGQYYVTVTISGCSTIDTINVTAAALPTVNLGNDTSICEGYSLILNAQNSGASYIWDNAATTQTRIVSAAGSYHVAVTSAQNCIGRDTINITVLNNPLVNLGNDTTICSNTPLELVAANTGASYFWDNATTNQTRVVTAAGQYFVKVTDANNCMGSDTINVSIVPLPTGDFTATEGANGLFNFNATTANATTYSWSFGDDSTGTGNPTSHTYATNGTYTVVLTIKNECGDSIQIQKVITVTTLKVNSLNNDKNVLVYPNPTNNVLTIENKDNVAMEQIVITDALGRTLKNVVVSQQQKVTISVAELSNGVYTISIQKQNGKVVRKFNISR